MKARRLPEAFEPNAYRYFVSRPAPADAVVGPSADAVRGAPCVCDAPECPGREEGRVVQPSDKDAHLYPVGFRNAGVCFHSVNPRLSDDERALVRYERAERYASVPFDELESFVSDYACPACDLLEDRYALAELRLAEAGL